MLIVNPIGADAGRYYFSDTPSGRWCGAARRDLGLDGIVTRAALDTVLRGRRPHDGTPLSARRTPHRRAGWDLIFTAPKSVSLLAALGADDANDVVTAAHRRACADAFGWLEVHGCWARRQGGLVPTSGFVAARFGHRVNAADEPHLHTHVLIANVACDRDGRWSAVDGSGLWLNRRAVAAVYHLALRQQLLAAGLRPDWSVRPDGTADIATVPRPAIEATSSRRRQIQDRLTGHDEPAPVSRIATQRLTRVEAETGGSWHARATAAGFGPDEVSRLLGRAQRRARDAGPAPRDDPTAAGDDPAAARHLADKVTVWLAQRRSTFGVVDVLQALSATHAEGASASEAHRWALEFIATSPRADDGRHTSLLARTGDVELLRAAQAGSVAHGLDRAGGQRGRDPAGPPAPARPGPRRDPPGSALSRLTAVRYGVVVLAPPDPATTVGQWPVTRAKGGFLAQADLLDAARGIWQQRGETVAVATSSHAAARRWRALAGLDRFLPGGPPPAVLIVDRADRHTTAELTAILARAPASRTRIVLVEGGTLSARRVAISQGLQWLGDGQGRIVPSVDAGLTAGGAGPPRRAGRPDGTTVGRLTTCRSGSQAIEQVVSSWSRSRHDGAPTRMVALGPSECDELNRRARLALRTAGALTGREAIIGGRPFAIGDEVTATRRGVLPAGAMGRVCDIGAPGSMVVAWAGGPTTVDAGNGRHLRHAYATTPGMLHFSDGPVVALGDSADLGRHHRRLAAAITVGPSGPDLRSGPVVGYPTRRAPEPERNPKPDADLEKGRLDRAHDFNLGR
jgi:conjugative relaxase-like TrwC/TraI family protein